MLDELGITLPPLVAGKDPSDTTVVVAMSGGVDSSVVAGLLHHAGYNVLGMTLQLWDYTPASNAGAEKKFGTCCALDDVYDARRVCQTLGVPHYVINFESAFKESVIDDFVETYLAGATPIPCVRCNQRIKFDNLLQKAKSLGADVLVTGHYAQKVVGADGSVQLHMGVDNTKDQTYFLFTTTPEQLAFTDFPLGQFTKDVTRDIAQKMGLHVHHKKDSQGICFVPGGDYRKVVQKFAPQALAAGNIVDETGTVLGRHDGVAGYTVGQRKGLGGGFTDPLYVLALRPASQEVVVGPKERLATTTFTIKELNWLDNKPAHNQEVLVRVRHGHQTHHATLKDLGAGRLEVVLHAPQADVSPGQAAVFYRDTQLLGGGWIEVPAASLRSAAQGVRVAIQ